MPMASNHVWFRHGLHQKKYLDTGADRALGRNTEKGEWP